MVDSLGQYIGQYMRWTVEGTTSTKEAVAMVRGGVVYQTEVTPDGFPAGMSSIDLFYTSTDCSGQAWTGFYPPQPHLFVQGPTPWQTPVLTGAICFAGRQPAGRGPTTVYSRERRSNAFQPATCIIETNPGGGLAPLIGCEDTSRLVPPFHIE